jgi:hypothetical protein
VIDPGSAAQDEEDGDEPEDNADADIASGTAVAATEATAAVDSGDAAIRRIDTEPLQS